MKSFVYIDGANLHQWSKKRKHALDYARFYKRLKDKYKPTKIYMFVWYIEEKKDLYSYLSDIWYHLVFKETLVVAGKVKWNCDAELVIQAVSDFYDHKTHRWILVSGDGDFGCLLDFYIYKKCTTILLAPNQQFCSYLLKKKNTPIVFLEEVCHKFGDKKEVKKPRKTKKKIKVKQKTSKRKYTKKPENAKKWNKENKKKAVTKRNPKQKKPPKETGLL